MEGPEVIIGAVRDEVFGPMVLVGIGGVVAEALDDVRMGLAPVSLAHAVRMIESLEGLRLLTEPRLGPPADLHPLAELVETLAARFVGAPSVASIEVNPLCWVRGAWLALDAAIEDSAGPAATPSDR